MLRRAFALFNRISQQPGSGQLTFLELQKYLQVVGLHSADVASVVDGLRCVHAVVEKACHFSAQPTRQACLNPTTVTFQDFALNYLWLQHTVESVLATYPPGSSVVSSANGWHNQSS